MVVRLKTNAPELLRDKVLTPGNHYRVVSFEYDHYRIIRDDGRPPGLYPSALFDVVSDVQHDDWIMETDAEGVVTYNGPECFAKPGFFEDVFEGNKNALQTLRHRLAKWSDGEDFTVNSGDIPVT